MARFERYPDGPNDTVCLRIAEIKPRAERPPDEDVRHLLDSSKAKLCEYEPGKPWTFTISDRQPAENHAGHRLWHLRLLGDLPDDTTW